MARVGEALTNERVSEEKLLTAGLLTKNDKVVYMTGSVIGSPIRDGEVG